MTRGSISSRYRSTPCGAVRRSASCEASARRRRLRRAGRWVEAPAGAVTETVTLAYAPLDASPEAPAGYQFAGRRFTLDAYRDGERLEGMQFAAPVTVTLA